MPNINATSGAANRQEVMALGDAELVDLYLGGSPDAFDPLYRRYRRQLVDAVRARVGDAALAEDIAHDAMLRAMEQLHRYDPARPLLPWLRTIALRIATDHYRKQRRLALRGDLADVCDIADEAQSPAAAVERRLLAAQDRRTLAEAMLDLAPRQREAVLLAYFHRSSPADAAARMGVTRNAFDQLLHRARANLRAAYLRLDPDGRQRLRTSLLGWWAAAAAATRWRARLYRVLCAVGGRAAPVVVGVALPMIVIGGAAGVLPSRDADAASGDSHTKTRTHLVRDVEHGRGRQRASASNRSAGAGQRDKQVDVRDARGRSDTSDSVRAPRGDGLSLGPATASASTARRGDEQRQRVEVTTPVAGKDQKTRYTANTKCSATVRRAVCDAERGVGHVVDQVEDATRPRRSPPAPGAAAAPDAGSSP